MEIIISKPAIVSATTLVLIIVIIAFIFAFAEKFPKRYVHYKRRLDDKWWEPNIQEIERVTGATLNEEDEYYNQRRTIYTKKRTCEK